MRLLLAAALLAATNSQDPCEKFPPPRCEASTCEKVGVCCEYDDSPCAGDATKDIPVDRIGFRDISKDRDDDVQKTLVDAMKQTDRSKVDAKDSHVLPLPSDPDLPGVKSKANEVLTITQFIRRNLNAKADAETQFEAALAEKKRLAGLEGRPVVVPDDPLDDDPRVDVENVPTGQLDVGTKGSSARVDFDATLDNRGIMNLDSDVDFKAPVKTRKGSYTEIADDKEVIFEKIASLAGYMKAKPLAFVRFFQDLFLKAGSTLGGKGTYETAPTAKVYIKTNSKVDPDDVVFEAFMDARGGVRVDSSLVTISPKEKPGKPDEMVKAIKTPSIELFDAELRLGGARRAEYDVDEICALGASEIKVDGRSISEISGSLNMDTCTDMSAKRRRRLSGGPPQRPKIVYDRSGAQDRKAADISKAPLAFNKSIRTDSSNKPGIELVVTDRELADIKEGRYKIQVIKYNADARDKNGVRPPKPEFEAKAMVYRISQSMGKRRRLQVADQIKISVVENGKDSGVFVGNDPNLADGSCAEGNAFTQCNRACGGGFKERTGDANTCPVQGERCNNKCSSTLVLCNKDPCSKLDSNGANKCANEDCQSKQQLDCTGQVEHRKRIRVIDAVDDECCSLQLCAADVNACSDLEQSARTAKCCGMKGCRPPDKSKGEKRGQLTRLTITKNTNAKEQGQASGLAKVDGMAWGEYIVKDDNDNEIQVVIASAAKDSDFNCKPKSLTKEDGNCSSQATYDDCNAAMDGGLKSDGTNSEDCVYTTMNIVAEEPGKVYGRPSGLRTTLVEDDNGVDVVRKCGVTYTMHTGQRRRLIDVEGSEKDCEVCIPGKAGCHAARRRLWNKVVKQLPFYKSKMALRRRLEGNTELEKARKVFVDAEPVWIDLDETEDREVW